MTPLSPRQREVLTAYVTMRSVTRTADHFTLTYHTIRNHLARIRAQAGATRTLEAARLYGIEVHDELG